MKTKKEMDVLKEEVKSVNEEMRELTEEELAQVSGGGIDLPVSGGLAAGIGHGHVIEVSGVELSLESGFVVPVSQDFHKIVVLPLIE